MKFFVIILFVLLFFFGCISTDSLRESYIENLPTVLDETKKIPAHTTSSYTIDEGIYIYQINSGNSINVYLKPNESEYYPNCSRENIIRFRSPPCKTLKATTLEITNKNEYDVILDIRIKLVPESEE